MIKSNGQGLWSLPGETEPEDDLSLDAERFGDDSLSVHADRSRQHRGTYPEETREAQTQPKVLNETSNSPSNSYDTVPKVPDSSLLSSQSRSPNQSRELSSSATDLKVPGSQSSDSGYSLAAYRQREDRTGITPHVTLSGTEEEGIKTKLD